MDDPEYDEFVFEVEDQPGWSTAVLFAIALAILVIAFVWFVIRIDPLLGDFFPADEPTPTIVSPGEGL